MEFGFIIILGVMGYLIYKGSSKKNPPPDELSLALNTPHEQLSDYQKQLLVPLFTSSSSDYSVEKNLRR